MRPRPALIVALTSLAAAALAGSHAAAAPAPAAATDATVVDVDLPAMGANPNKKDLFVEMDYMSGRLASTAALDRIVQVFATAPVSNPDGSTGITIHLDAGGARGAKYDLGGGNEVTYDDDLNPSATQTNAIKAANFATARKAAKFQLS
ncbi:hypothetical protein ACXJJ3_23175 [Kribbella sp. WER1]